MVGVGILELREQIVIVRHYLNMHEQGKEYELPVASGYVLIIGLIVYTGPKMNVVESVEVREIELVGLEKLDK